ncbi:mandelate racemase/muconate lactonizing enzyme family protein [Palleronia caenipelagi]|uniref:Mandelate racemase/muconate lactonizing enzyme family protein n=2 Tax=Palleronia caenipelagi TaxID=2489174 RepID=A0A547PMJ8_9RHOB|nr:mandelate racemase/muconate lactonizing enzyme family protein [Palleronia caenipelagi]TRD15346.1 mandelate racemase/muconate lactonizing enzyme family protein [Palleronia caenipelagi]
MTCEISKIDVWTYRVPIENPVITSFGAMHSRPAVFLRLEDRDGCFGWGEIFANWPAAGAEHRARLLIEDVSDLVLGYPLEHSAALRTHLTERTHIRALQCGEWGPFAHVISGLDIAIHDLFARRSGLPLARYLMPGAAMSVPTYASGIHIRDADKMIEGSREHGYAAFKVKVGFNLESDSRAVIELCKSLGQSERLFADANQGWYADEAITFLRALDGAPLGWLEEPLPADAPIADWHRTAEVSQIPLAGGENIAGSAEFTAAITSGIFGVIQPDVAKWGGLSGCREVAIRTMGQGRLYCPHFLGGGIGLAASAAVLASVGGGGLLEVDANPNPLREAFGLWNEGESRGHLLLRDKPGLGILKLPEQLKKYETLYATTASI